MVSETGRMSVIVEPGKQTKLDAIAENYDRSRNWIVNQAIDNYLDIYDWQTKRIEEALEIASSENAVFHSSEEIDAMIAEFK
jgi:predicted transcriptional regulator